MNCVIVLMTRRDTLVISALTWLCRDGLEPSTLPSWSFGLVVKSLVGHVTGSCDLLFLYLPSSALSASLTKQVQTWLSGPLFTLATSNFRGQSKVHNSMEDVTNLVLAYTLVGNPFPQRQESAHWVHNSLF